MKYSSLVFALLLSGVVRVASATEASPLVELHWQGKQMEQSETVQKRLLDQAVLLVESSNFHSGPGDKYHFFTLSALQSDYRATVAGRYRKYLVVTFPIPRKIKTMGEEVTVAEIIVGLNRDDFASSLFTIDESGHVVGHAKYSGERCVELLKAVKQVVHDDA